MRWGKWLAATTIAVGAVAVTGIPASAASQPVPFTDSNAAGSLTLCDAHDNPVTSGDIRSQPFVAKVVSTAGQPSGYTLGKARATLYVFQPRRNYDPSDWSGQQLTGSTVYTNAKHPAAVSVGGDAPLIWFVTGYPPSWDGLVQLRLYYSQANTVRFTGGYPAVVLKISGERWTVLNPAAGNCAASSGVSNESKYLKHTSPLLASHPPIAGAGKSAPIAGSTAGATTTDASSSGGATDAAAQRNASSSSSWPAVIGIVIAAALAAAVTMWWRRRSGSATSREQATNTQLDV